ncbi:hypothetical protein [Bradyrhizobium hipponense]|uniref:hypothetical protein n=1 Tax=Bradyrhizobium hipponense TaxID=2605638 RepID=UPI001652FE8B|nr:hypothetical protein [Bradyrhizobium hipponense]
MVMTVFCANNCDTPVEPEVVDLGAGAGQIRCLECGGDGNWGKFAPEIVGPNCKCIDCKGTGAQLVSI